MQDTKDHVEPESYGFLGVTSWDEESGAFVFMEASEHHRRAGCSVVALGPETAEAYCPGPLSSLPFLPILSLEGS